MAGDLTAIDIGKPVACIATTYTFHAAFFETDLLPRFLGLKFDNTEREASFLIEREQALGTGQPPVSFGAPPYRCRQRLPALQAACTAAWPAVGSRR